MAIEELHDDVVAVARFWHVRVIEESMEEPVPRVQFDIHALLDEYDAATSHGCLEALRAEIDQPEIKSGDCEDRGDRCQAPDASPES